MPYNREPLDTIAQRVKANMTLKVRDENGQSVDCYTAGTGWTELAESMAGLAYELQGRQLWIADQILVRTCSPEILVAKAAERGLPRIAPAFANGTAEATGTNGSLIAAGRVLQHNNGQRFRVLTDATIVGGVATLSLIALIAGVDGNVSGNLSFVQSLDGVDGIATIDGSTSSGANIESIDRLRTRLLEHLAQPPMGGKDYDYVAWARAAHVDVTRVFPFFHEDSIGDIVIRFVTEDLDNPIPTPAHVTAVQEFIELQKPAGTGNFTVEAPNALPLNLVFTSLVPNTPEVRAAIEAEVKDLLRREGRCAGNLLLSHIRQAISNAPGEEDFVITQSLDFVTAADEFPVWGTPTWP